MAPDPAAPTERRRPLAWLPNALTLARVALAPAILAALIWAAASPVAALANGRTTLAAALLLLAAGLDWLDGRLARSLKVESAFGRFWDPLADKLVIGAALIGGAVAAPQPWFVAPAALLLLRDAAVTWLRTRPRHAAATAAPSRLAKWKTALEYAALVLLFSAALLARGVESIIPDSSLTALVILAVTGAIVLWIATGLSLWTGWSYLRRAGSTH